MSLHILMLEDESTDAELIVDTLGAAGLDFASKVVGNRADFMAALETFKPDIVLADYQLPEFDGLSAVRIVRQLHPEVPVVMVTGALRDVDAVELLKAGARDYVLKDRLVRLGLAVRRVLAEEQGIRGRKAAERRLEASETRYRRLFETTRDGILIVDVASGTIVDANPRIFEVLGYGRDELIGQKVWKLGPLQDVAASQAAFSELQQKEYIRYVDLSLATRDGGLVDVEVICNVYEAGNEKVVQYNIRDITERKHLTAGLRESDLRFRQLSDSIRDVFFLMSIDGGQMLYVSQACQQLWGCTAESLYANPRGWLDRIHPDDRKRVARIFRERLYAGAESFESEYRIVRPDDEVRWVRVRGFPVLDESGKPYRIAGAATDITGQKELVQAMAGSWARLERSNRTLLTLGACRRLAAGAAGEAPLLNDICRVLVEQGGYSAACIGYARQGVEHGVAPMACLVRGGMGAPGNAAMLEQESVGAALASGVTQVCHPAPGESWRVALAQLGDCTVAAIPLLEGAEAFGVLVLLDELADAFNLDEILSLEELAGDLSSGIAALQGRAAREGGIRQSLESVIASIVGGHCAAGGENRVGLLAMAIAGEMDLGRDAMENLRLAGLVHDIGMLCVPAAILGQAGALSGDEFDLVKKHAQAGCDRLQPLGLPRPIARMVLEHHERLDGSGYPRGLSDGEILLESQILAVADVVSAMSSPRPYRPASSVDVALDEVWELRGRRYNADAAQACVRLFRERGFAFPA